MFRVSLVTTFIPELGAPSRDPGVKKNSTLGCRVSSLGFRDVGCIALKWFSQRHGFSVWCGGPKTCPVQHE